MIATRALVICRDKGVVHRGDSVIKINGIAFELLVALSERQGRVVDARTLMARLWPNRDVNQANLRNNVNALRKALGDVVVNVAGRGYLLAEPVAIKEQSRDVARREKQEQPSTDKESGGGPESLLRDKLVEARFHPIAGLSVERKIQAFDTPANRLLVASTTTASGSRHAARRKSQQPKSEGHRVGRVVILPGRREIEVCGLPARVGARSFDLLSVLAEQVGEFVEKSVLISRVWPATLVEEGALRVHITKLRKALGRDALLEIEAVRGHGYRLVVRDETFKAGAFSLMKPTGG